MNEKQIYYSHAKVNLGLQILNKREDGYHNLHSLLVELDLADELIFFPSARFKLTAEGKSSADLPLDDCNLITKSYKLIKSNMQSIPTEYSIHLKKNIPIGSGLAGGSSNAATTLKALNKLWELNFSLKKLETFGAKLGADVPFFIRGGFQLAEGIGEILTPQDGSILQGVHFLLVFPLLHISTAKAYRLLNKSLCPEESHSKFSPVSKPMNWQLFDNDFEKVIRKAYPEIGNIKESLQGAGALFASLSGSGSTVFGAFDNLQAADLAREYFSHYQTFLTSPVFHS